MNNKVYIHEFIDITKQNRARYMQHMTANWSPIAQEQRGQLCYGVWGVVGSTGRWPQVVNLWEEDGLDGLAESFSLELGSPTLQDPALAKWWAAAADLRSGGFDRLLVPHPETGTIEALCESGAGATTYAHEIVRVDPGGAMELCDAAVAATEQVHERIGWQLIGAWRTAMSADDECVLLWAIPGWPQWSAGEQVLLDTPNLLYPASAAQIRHRHRILLIDAPLAPLRTGRQPHRDDRTDWED
ncbi:MAG TPA: hypothetical protein VHW74_04135 [Mycobacteriales bacterium]|jgi:hypothetical protein|nr:hypothetical protein [Mycobacteriales bacterium]